MVRIYRTRVNSEIEECKIEYLMSQISSQSREKYKRYHFRMDSLRSLYGEILVRYYIKQNFPVLNEDLIFRKNAYGKPYVEGLNLEYNISHSGQWVVCAFGEKKVGIDIEEMKKMEFSIAERFFCRQEIDALNARKASEKQAYFYMLWTLKESYIKWLGNGLHTALDSFCFEITEEGIHLSCQGSDVRPNFIGYPMKDYKLFVCSEEEEFSSEINEIDMGILAERRLLS